MDLDSQIPILIFHVLEADIPQNAGIVDEHIDPSKRLDGSLDDVLPVLDAVVVCDRFAACGFDLINDYIGGLQPSV